MGMQKQPGQAPFFPTLAGFAVQWLARWSLAALVGVHVSVGGGLEGLMLGGAAGLGYAWRKGVLKWSK